jgi:hypothetical protein
MKRKIIFIIALINILSCANPKTDIPVLDVEKAMTNPVDFDLDEYIDEIKYVKLETRPDCLVGAINRVLHINDEYYLSSWNQLYKFSSTGRFVRQIGKIGRGPAEFGMISEMSYNKVQNELCISDYDEIVKYDTCGNFIKRDKLRALDNLTTFKINEKGDYFFKMPHAPKEKIAVNLYDKDLNLLKTFNNSIVRDKGLQFQAQLSQYNKKIYYNSLVNDTIFSIDDKLKCKAEIVLDYGKFKIPNNEIEYNSTGFKKGYYMISFYMGDNISLFTFSQKMNCKGYLLYFNKKDKIVHPRKISKDLYLGVLMNDLEWQIEDFCNGNIILSIDPVELLDNKDKIKDPELLKMCKNLKEEDNVILASVRIKG